MQSSIKNFFSTEDILNDKLHFLSNGSPFFDPVLTHLNLRIFSFHLVLYKLA